MSVGGWSVCAGWIAASAVAAATGARRGAAEGRTKRAIARLKSPTLYLFTAYLLVAAIATRPEPGESASPLLGLGVILPFSYLLASLSAIGADPPSLLRRGALAALHGGAVLASAAIILALASPRYLPEVLR